MESRSVVASRFCGSLVAARQLLHGELTVQQLTLLLLVYGAGTEGMVQGELVDKYELSRSHVSKTAADLSSLTSTKKPGPGLIESAFDPADFRIRILRCTEKGVQIVEKILRAGWPC